MVNQKSYNRPTLKYTPYRYIGNSISLSSNYPRRVGHSQSSFRRILSRPRPRPLALRSPSIEALPSLAEQEQMDQDLQIGTYDLGPAKLNGLMCELQRYNRQGQMVTYDRSRGPLGGWAPWLR